MADTWTVRWAPGAQQRFNMVHAPAGAATGGQFAASGGSAAAAAPAKTAPAKAAAGGKGQLPAAKAAEKARLLAQAHKDAAQAAALEKQLGPLVKQEAAAQAASKKSLAAAAAAKKAGKVHHHHKHATHHAAATKHHASLKRRIADLKGQIHTLREKAAGLEKQANAIRSDGAVPGAWARRESDLKYGHGSHLWEYWTKGAGFAKWSGAVHKWTTLRDLLLKAGVPADSAVGLTTNIIQAVMPDYMKQAHAEKHAGRAVMTEPAGDHDGDGLDSSWDGDHSDLPDLTGLDVPHFEAAEKALGMTPPGQASRAMPKLGTGARFAKLKSSLAAKGAKNPGALAAYIGQKKFGKAKFHKLASAARGKGANRMDTDTLHQQACTARAEYMRLYPLEDIHILRSADGGDGRTVEAFAAVFDDPAEIVDGEGHYVETIDRSAFNKVLADASRARGGFPGSVKVLYNHGMTIQGTPSERFSMPIGVPVDIRAEQRGLLTRTRYSDTPLAEEILENIRAGSITSQSFTGRIVRSDPMLRRGDRHRPDTAGNLRTVRRTELGLREYGPVLWPAYSGAEILGVRMSTPGALGNPEPDEPDEALPPDEEAAAGSPLTRDDGEHETRYHQHALYVLRAKEARERVGLVW